MLGIIKSFNKRILFHFEPPVVTPDVYNNLDKIGKIYQKVFLLCDLRNSNYSYNDSIYSYFSYPQTYNEIIKEYWNNKDRAFLTLINSNKRPNSKRAELYSERIKAIKFFAGKKDIDLYGMGWTKRPFFPYTFCGRTISKVYKGIATSKYETLSRYTFAITFENMIINGYITEKLFDCFFVGTVPIYLGAPDIARFVPKNCFIDMRDYSCYQELYSHLKSMTLIEIDTYRMNARNYLGSKSYKPFTKESFSERFAEAILEV
jgi:hypothetical protein